MLRQQMRLYHLSPLLIKSLQPCNNNFEMLRILRDDYSGDVHISFGMTTHREENEIVTFFEEKNQSNRLILYACTSGYPVPFEDVCMLEIIRIKKKFEKKSKSDWFLRSSSWYFN